MSLFVVTMTYQSGRPAETWTFADIDSAQGIMVRLMRQARTDPDVLSLTLHESDDEGML